MPSDPDPAVLRYGIRGAGAVGIIIGCFFLAAWFLGWGAQWSASGTINPKTNLALGAFLAGSALFLLYGTALSRPRRAAAAVLAALVLLIGALTLSEHLFRYDLGIDQLLATELPGAAATTSPNRMGPPAATSLTLLGAGLLLLACKRRRIAPYLGLTVCLIDLVPAVGYLYGISSFYGRAQLTGIAWPTVLALFSLGTGLVLTSPDSGPMAMLLRQDGGGLLLRRLMPAVVLIPFVLGFLTMQARHRDLVDRATATGLLVIALVVIFSVMLWRSAAHLSRAGEELARLASFPKLNPNPITELDFDGRIHFANPAARAFFPDLEQRGLEHPWLAGWESVVNAVGKARAKIPPRDVSVGERQYVQTIWYVPETGRIRIYGMDITERKRAEEALRRTEEARNIADNAQAERQRLLGVLETMPVMVCLLTPDYHVAWSNRSFRQKFGESNGRHCYEFCFGRTAPCDFCESYNLLKTGQPHRWEANGPDGSVIDVYDFPFTDVDGSPMILEMDVDITEQRRTEAELKRHRQHLEELVQERTSQLQTANVQLRSEITEREQTEAALRESEERFRVAQELSPDGFSILKPIRNAEKHVIDFTWVYANATTARYTGTEPQALVGRSLLALFPGHRGSPLLETYQQVAETGETRVCEAQYQGDGTLAGRWFRVAVLSMGHDIAVLSQDITERKQAEEAARRAAAFNEAAMTSLGEGLYTIDDQGVVTFMNPASEQLFGWSFAELRGKKMHDLTHHHHPDGRRFPSSECACFQVLTHGQPLVNHEDVFIRKDGTFFPVTYTISPMRDNTGKIAGLVVVFRDITERKRAEELLIRSEKVAALGRMAASLAHDINNPLSAVMNTLFLARGSSNCPPSVRQYLEIADEELKRVSHITRQALGFYREGSTPANVSLRAILDETLNVFKSKIKSKRAGVERQYEGDVVQVVGISGELRQVFSNLFDNSLDAIAENGIIKLRVSTFPGQRVRVTIADDGKGIEAAVRPRIFEPLFTTKGSLGTGLGLWVTKQLVEKHGGSIRVHSSTNGSRRGTTFSVVLPAATAERHHSAAG